MSDYLLVAGGGLGGWAWGQTWGYMTAPAQHPPRLYSNGPIGKVVSINLAGLTGREANPHISQNESISAISAAAKANALVDLVLVGHDVAAPLVLRAAASMETPPKRIVMVGGIIPGRKRSFMSVFPPLTRLAFIMMTAPNGSKSKGLKLPKHVISNVLCSSMSAEEVIQAVGFFQPVPVKVMKSRVNLRDVVAPSPITYVVLTQDKLVSPRTQRRMAPRLGQVELVDLDSCHAAMLHSPRALAHILLRYA